jgi:hypothetical protein
VSLASLLGQTATVTRRVEGIEDEYGSPVLADSMATDYRARLEPTGSVEQLVGQDRVVTDFALYLPADAAISHLDHVSIDGTDYEVVGEPARQSSPRGPHHIVAALRRIQGG